jgi:hypothetical protein
LVGQNSAMLLKLGQLASTTTDPVLAKEAQDLVHSALRLRVNLILAQPCLRLKWLLPGWALTLPAVGIRYDELLSYLGRVRTQQQLDVKGALIAG